MAALDIMTNDNWLDDILQRIPAARVTVFGDFCLDAYWMIDDDGSELSVETGLPVRRVRQQRYSLGGAGNIVANLASLGVQHLLAVGMIGDDLFGRRLLDLLGNLGAGTESVVSCQADWQTCVYAKPHIAGAEQGRIDFGAFNTATPQSIDRMTVHLTRAAETSDVVILNQQIPVGLSEAPMIERINRVIAEHPNCGFIVDSRHRGELYKGGILKVNTHEAARLCGRESPPDKPVSHKSCSTFAEELQRRTAKPVFITLGTNGMVVANEDGVAAVPGIRIAEPIDAVGAGDTVVATLAAALAVRADALTAAKLANVAAAVTVRKLGTTGTATAAEIQAVAAAAREVHDA